MIDYLNNLKKNNAKAFDELQANVQKQAFDTYGAPNTEIIEQMPNKATGVILSHIIGHIANKPISAVEKHINTVTGCIVTSKNPLGVTAENLKQTIDKAGEINIKFVNAHSYCQPNKYGWTHEMSNKAGVYPVNVGKLQGLATKLDSPYVATVIDYFNKAFELKTKVTIETLCDFVTTTYKFKLQPSTKKAVVKKAANKPAPKVKAKTPAKKTVKKQKPVLAS
jgi:hypothetical protein